MGNLFRDPGREGLTEAPASCAGERPSRLAALAVAGGLSLLFFAVYGACNAVADRAREAAAIFADWEMRIPFVPAAIVPYWSIDLLFFAAPFLLPTRRALRLHALRVAAATLAAGVFFVVFPMTFAWPRPAVTGPLGALFGALDAMDRPHNLFPSLHVAYATLLWPAFAGLPRAWRAVLRGVLVLTVASTLVTWQHHAADLGGGFALGLVCLMLWPASEPDAAPGGGVHVFPGLLYAAGSAACLGAAALHPALWPLAWPAFALGWTAAAYLGLGPAALRKTRGRLQAPARILLAPVLAGARLNAVLRSARRAPWSEVAPGVYVGRALTASEATDLRLLGVVRVLDLAAEFPATCALRGIEYRSLPVLDLTAPPTGVLREAVSFLRGSPGPVFVHCALGLGRSAAVAAAYLLAAGLAPDVGAAIAAVRRARPGAVFPAAVRRALDDFAVNPDPGTALHPLADSTRSC